MTCPTKARCCRNCYHLWYACQESRAEACPKYEHQQQGIQRQLSLLEKARRHTLLGGVALLVMLASPVVWAYL